MDSTTKDSLNSFTAHVNGFDYTQLGISCKNNNLYEVTKLISKGADIDLAKKDEIYEYDALSVAIENKHLQIVDYLIKQKADVNKVYNEDGLTPLGLATKLNAVEIVEILIKNGADVNGAKVVNADHKESPLLIAINGDHIAIAKLLILSGADANDKDNHGTSIKSLILSKGKEWEKLLSNPYPAKNKPFGLQGEYLADESELDDYGISLSFDNGTIVYTESGNMGRTYNQYELLEDKIENNKIFLKYQKTLNGHTGEANKNEFFGVLSVVDPNKFRFESAYLMRRFGVGKTLFSK